MDLNLFEKVTKVENGELKGLKIDLVPEEYKEKMKTFKQEFNRLVNQINIYDLKIDYLDSKWQGSGYYKKYFWSKLFFKDEKYLNKDLCFWIGADVDGLHIYLGTSDNFVLASKEDVLKFIIKNIDMNKKFNNFRIDTEYDYLRYTYIGNKNNINVDDFIQIIEYLKPTYRMLLDKFVNKKNVFSEIKNVINIKNIILYGAPGVGKTHNYKNLISMIEDGKNQNDIFETISQNDEVNLDNDTFERIKQEKRVEFVTFHQSYSYEDFIEGFRPNENGKIELEDGIFKKLSALAINQSKKVVNKQIIFDDAFDILRTLYIDDELETLKTISKTEIIINNFKEKSLNVQTTKAKDSQSIKKNDLEIVVDGILNNDVLKPSDIRQLNVKKDTMSLSSYYFPIANKIVEIINENQTDSEEQKNFYIVIDEINRGNISKIFGELITLIEEDKRDKYEITLPYSKESFKVPSNLYIIATMNSTDKSIATIDIALRRRFTFLKMKPNLDLVKNPDANSLMNKLNIYIEKKLGEDYKLGHSYFMNVQNSEDLEFVKEYKIKPLLEEYFYSDDKSADEILKEVGVSNEESNEQLE